jgi:protoporphyrinogen oxidase
MNRQSALVIGGGPAGLKAAHELAKQGLQVTLCEASPVVGGLASAFETGGVTIERYYHFICKGDDDLLATLDELELSALLRWRSSRMAYFVAGRLYPFLTPIDLLRFRPLSLWNRARAGFALKWAQRQGEERLAPQHAIPWLTEMFGEAAYRIIWEPLMRFKFAHYAPEVSAAWIWARMVRLSRSRRSPFKEELGYLEGGSARVMNTLAGAIEQRGGRILLKAPVEKILLAEGRVTGARVNGETLPADLVVSTITTPVFTRLIDGLQSDYLDRIRRIPTIGVFCLFLRLTRSVTPYFWVNANDARVPFAGMIEYTNLNPLPALEGERILYVPQYLSPDDPRFAWSDEAIYEKYTDALALIHPAFDRKWVRSWSVFRDRYAQPICLTDYRETTPTIASPIANLFVTDSCQLHPHDRSISGSLGLGKMAAQLAHASLKRHA